MFVNDTDYVDANGLPPHSIMVLADYAGADDPALDALVAQAIWEAKGAGTATSFGTTIAPWAFTATVTDASGASQTILWARPQPVPIYVTADVTYDNTPGVFPASEGTGSAAAAPQLKGAVTTFGIDYSAGANVRASALAAAIARGPSSADAGATAVPGVLDVTVKLGTAPAPGGSTPVAITALQRATFDTANVVVNLTGAAP